MAQNKRTNFSEAFEGKTICIPQIQRDYVQSYSLAVMESLIDQFVGALVGDTHVDLNYIYGIHEEKNESGFIPVDGQQRLTTLWLFHLYLARRVGADFDVELHYESREYADQFCVSLRSNDNWADSEHLAESVSNQSWFISEWCKDPSVDAMLQGLEVIGRKLKNKPIEEISGMWDKLASNESPIVFAFYSTESLGDDIYIKMNGRGRSLTKFENFKSWIDEQLSKWSKSNEVPNISEDFYSEWKHKIDNDWTDLFWTHRTSYEIDEMQLRAFYNLAYLYWQTKDEQVRSSIIDDKNKDDIRGLTGIADKSEQDIIKEVFSHVIQKTNYSFAPYVLDKIAIFNSDFFVWARDVLDGLCDIKYDFRARPEDKTYFWEFDGTTSLYRNLMAPDSQVKVNLLLVHSICTYAIYQDKLKPDFKDWMYRWHNLIPNAAFTDDRFHKVLHSISSIAQLCQTTDINDVFNSGLSLEGFNDKFVKFEGYKSEILKFGNNEMIDALHRLENNLLFVGSGIILSSMIPADEALKEPERFIKYCDLLNKLFDKDGPKEGEDDLFRRALIYFGNPKKGFGGYEGGLWSFLNGKNDWRWFINETGDEKIPEASDKTEKDINREALKNLLEYLSKFDIAEVKDKLENITKIYNHTSEYSALSKSDWRFPFVYEPGVLNYMWQKCCKLDATDSIILSRSSRLYSNDRRMNIKTLLLYYEIQRIISDPVWSIGMYEKDNSCVTLSKSCDSKPKLIITAEYMDIDKAYSIRVRIDDLDNDSEILLQLLSEFNYTGSISESGLRRNGLSRDETISELKRLCRLFADTEPEQ